MELKKKLRAYAAVKLNNIQILKILVKAGAKFRHTNTGGWFCV